MLKLQKDAKSKAFFINPLTVTYLSSAGGDVVIKFTDRDMVVIPRVTEQWVADCIAWWFDEYLRPYRPV